MSETSEPDDTPGASNSGNTGAGGTGATGTGSTTTTTTTTDPTDTGGSAGAGAGTVVIHSERFAWAPYAVGFAVLLGYAIFLNRMIDSVRVDNQTFWDRYLYLFSSVEALAFAAAGFFFGREVNRGRAQAAESRANAEANRASQAEKKEADAKAKGEVLADSLKQLADGAGAEPGAAHGFAPEGFAPPAVVPAQQVRGLANLADRWFPRR
ncbi:MAG TPA: hypothetical protein VEQ60_09310 [Longimicrobium sp.]|nr:hypothetical protein [Longimicrobium sp.]